MTAIDADLAKLPPSATAIEAAHRAQALVAASRLNKAAPWITHTAAYAADFRQEPIALQFRRVFKLPRKPARLAVQVSADQRFVLYVNGYRVAAGPARGDLRHYRYERIDLAPYLKGGRNVLAAQIWSDGKLAPAAMISAGYTGFMLKAESTEDRYVDTGGGWEVRVDRSRTLTSARRQLNEALGPTYYVAGPPERHDAARQLIGWYLGGAGTDWARAVPAASAGVKARTLVPDPLPQMRYDAASSAKVVRLTGAGPIRPGPIVVPAGQRASVLFDFGRVMAGYPVLITSGGKGGAVSLTYSEALYEPTARRDGKAVRFADRGRIADGKALGLTDSFIVDGRKLARFAPFWWRVGRFVELNIVAGEKPLTINGLDLHGTGYPLEQRGSFVSDDAALNRIWQIGWDTARLNAHETFMDTAYWEQLQYIGDARIQALLSYDVSGDPRLARQALDAFDASRVVDGFPQGAWPMSGANSIPPFGFLYIGMLHDYWMRWPDHAVLQRNLGGMRAVLSWYERFVQSDGMAGTTPNWTFIDWRDGLGAERNNPTASSNSCVVSLMRIGALRSAIDLERAIGDRSRAATYLAQADLAARGVSARCWDEGRGLYSDDTGHRRFSQHANALAALYDVAPQALHKRIMERVTVATDGIDAPHGITGTTFYFSFYLAQALDHAGLAERYQDLLITWRRLLDQRFTSWPEEPDPSRSDSHAWSAHPTSGLLSYVAGIRPAAPGSAKIIVAPQLGSLKTLKATMPHPRGVIRVQYRVVRNVVAADISLPAGLTGTYILGGKAWPLRPGKNRVSVVAR